VTGDLVWNCFDDDDSLSDGALKTLVRIAWRLIGCRYGLMGDMNVFLDEWIGELQEA